MLLNTAFLLLLLKLLRCSKNSRDRLASGLVQSSTDGADAARAFALTAAATASADFVAVRRLRSIEETEKGGRGEAVREGSLSGVTDKWQETNREPVPWLMFVMSLGAGAAAAILEIQLCT